MQSIPQRRAQTAQPVARLRHCCLRRLPTAVKHRQGFPAPVVALIISSSRPISGPASTNNQSPKPSRVERVFLAGTNHPATRLAHSPNEAPLAFFRLAQDEPATGPIWSTGGNRKAWLHVSPTSAHVSESPPVRSSSRTIHPRPKPDDLLPWPSPQHVNYWLTCCGWARGKSA